MVNDGIVVYCYLKLMALTKYKYLHEFCLNNKIINQMVFLVSHEIV